MAYRLCSTLNPAEEVYEDHGTARLKLNQLMDTLMREGYKTVGYELAPNRERAMMKHLATGEVVELHMRSD